MNLLRKELKPLTKTKKFKTSNSWKMHLSKVGNLNFYKIFKSLKKKNPADSEEIGAMSMF